MRDLKRELEEWDGWPEPWKPEPGDVLVGRVVQYSTAMGRYGPCRTCIIERDEGGRVAVWLSLTVLLDLFKKEKPQVGERIGLKYLGRDEAKGYHRYRLIVDRAEPEPSFEPLGGEVDNGGQADLWYANKRRKSLHLRQV
jgi:hypothetical protein